MNTACCTKLHQAPCQSAGSEMNTAFDSSDLPQDTTPEMVHCLFMESDIIRRRVILLLPYAQF
ncbi:hypothetical protein SADUNF_Sadunf12G0013600 [Salix dunnii]|uniref:Uncharacterized protein n=1 Tax=Salix dunnii TaxID=1413687 RepID=A0A835JKI8_9ROSI|nr:hypothetical protein SADUNF_Sadunf12G0013600 [Salix dunnii]